MITKTTSSLWSFCNVLHHNQKQHLLQHHIFSSPKTASHHNQKLHLYLHHITTISLIQWRNFIQFDIQNAQQVFCIQNAYKILQPSGSHQMLTQGNQMFCILHQILQPTFCHRITPLQPSGSSSILLPGDNCSTSGSPCICTRRKTTES